MSRQPQESWPPLIVASEKPRWVVWRDFALTLLMWLIFAIMLETEFELFFGRYLERLGWGDFDTNANWARFFQRLEPYLWLIVMLVALLAASTVATLHRLRRFLKQAPPPSLQATEQASARRNGRRPSLLAVRELAQRRSARGARRQPPRRAAASGTAVPALPVTGAVGRGSLVGPFRMSQPDPSSPVRRGRKMREDGSALTELLTLAAPRARA